MFFDEKKLSTFYLCLKGKFSFQETRFFHEYSFLFCAAGVESIACNRADSSVYISLVIQGYSYLVITTPFVYLKF